MADLRIVVLALAVVVASTSVPRAESAVSCGQVFGLLAPCVNYLRLGGPCPDACCNGVKGLNSAAQTTAARQTVCGCLKSAAGAVPGLQISRAASLPSTCGISIPYKINPSVDCAKAPTDVVIPLNRTAQLIVLLALACAILGVGALGLHPAIQCALRCCCGADEEGVEDDPGGKVRVRVLPQRHHGFHVPCIDTWLETHPSWPSCRRSFLASPPEEEGRES